MWRLSKGETCEMFEAMITYYLPCHEVGVAGNVLLLIAVHGHVCAVSFRYLCTSVCLSVCLSVCHCLSVCLSVCLSATAWQVCHAYLVLT